MTHGEVIILRLLISKNYYGYELDGIIDDNQMRTWADIGFSSIYSILTKLEKKELVQSHFEKQHGSPRRKVYSITESGRAALKKQVGSMLASPAEIHDDLTVGLVVSDLLNREERDAYLSDYRALLEKKLENYRKHIPPAVQKKKWVMTAMDRKRRLLETEIRWLNEL